MATTTVWTGQDRQEGSLAEMTIDVTSITIHEDYDWRASNKDNDIAIIELAEEVDLTIYTPACLAKTSDTTTFDGKNAWVYGEITLLPIICDDNDICPRLGDNILWWISLRSFAGGGGPRGDQRPV